jgi:hypothetical protein
MHEESLQVVCGICRQHKSDNINLMFPPYAPSAALSMYAPMIKAWSEHVPLDQMRIINYQSLVDDPLSITNQILRYLGMPFLAQHVFHNLVWWLLKICRVSPQILYITTETKWVRLMKTFSKNMVEQACIVQVLRNTPRSTWTFCSRISSASRVITLMALAKYQLM